MAGSRRFLPVRRHSHNHFVVTRGVKRNAPGYFSYSTLISRCIINYDLESASWISRIL